MRFVNLLLQQQLLKSWLKTKGAKVIPYSASELDKITKTGYSKSTMPAGTYKGVPAMDLPYLTVYWVAHERVSSKAVQDILNLVYQPDVQARISQLVIRLGNRMEPDTKTSKRLVFQCTQVLLLITNLKVCIISNFYNLQRLFLFCRDSLLCK